MEYQWRGLSDYEFIYQQQKESLLWPSSQEVVWGLEHPSVVTLGRRTSLADEVGITNSGFSVFASDRGGLATFHNPGQLVIYPLLSLQQRQWGARDYVCRLINITKTCLLEWGVSATSDESHSGLFVGSNKICFIGLRITRGRTYHGLSLNVNNDLSFFKQIRSCGMHQRPMTSLRELGVSATPEEVFHTWQRLAPRFGFSKSESLESPENQGLCGSL